MNLLDDTLSSTKNDHHTFKKYVRGSIVNAFIKKKSKSKISLKRLIKSMVYTRFNLNTLNIIIPGMTIEILMIKE